MSTVLVVEDDALQRTLYQEELQDEGYEVWAVEDGRKAINLVRQQRPDVVVLDLHMPEMDGLDVLWRLVGVDHPLPVILYSGYSSYRDNFLSWLAEDYLVKSADLTPLKGAIRRALNQGTKPSERQGEVQKGDRPLSGERVSLPPTTAVLSGA